MLPRPQALTRKLHVWGRATEDNFSVPRRRSAMALVGLSADFAFNGSQWFAPYAMAHRRSAQDRAAVSRG